MIPPSVIHMSIFFLTKKFVASLATSANALNVNTEILEHIALGLCTVNPYSACRAAISPKKYKGRNVGKLDSCPNPK
jgi:hypothetical protein